MPARSQRVTDLGQELVESHHVVEHVVADDQIERLVEGYREQIEVDECRGLDAVQLAQDELLTLPDSHRMDIRAVMAPEAFQDRAGPRPHLEHPGAPWIEQRIEDVDVSCIRQPVLEDAREVIASLVIGHEDAARDPRRSGDGG